MTQGWLRVILVEAVRRCIESAKTREAKAPDIKAAIEQKMLRLRPTAELIHRRCRFDVRTLRERTAAAGHDRCIIPIRPENIDAWLSPDPGNLAAQYAILDDRERPYYEHRMAA